MKSISLQDIWEKSVFFCVKFISKQLFLYIFIRREKLSE